MEEARLTRQIKELEEAEEAAKQGILALQDLLDSLGSAANWGIWDMLGGGFFSTAIKHSKINNAKREAAHAQRSLERLSQELADVRLKYDLNIEIGGFATFADYFFDGLIADWVVQSRLNEARRRVEALLSQVKSIRQSLAAELKKAAQRVIAIKEQKTFN